MPNIRDVIKTVNNKKQRDYSQKYMNCTLTAIDYSKSCKVSGRKNYYWVKEYNNPTNVFIAYGPNIPDTVNLPVFVTRSKQPPHFKRQIIGLDYGRVKNEDIVEQLYTSHAPSHEWPDGAPGSDAITIYPRAIHTFSLRLYSGVAVYVSPGIYRHNGVMKLFSGAIYDLKTLLPANNKTKRVILYFNPETNIVDAVSSAEVTNGQSPAWPTAPDDTISSGWVLLNYDTTTLVEANITDAKALFSVSGGVNLNTSDFDKILSVADDTVQKALNTIDDMIVNAVQLQGVPIDLTDIADGNALIWDEASNTFIPGVGGGGYVQHATTADNAYGIGGFPVNTSNLGIDSDYGMAIVFIPDQLMFDVRPISGMLKSVYDTNNNGVVDNSEKLENHAASYFATADHTHSESGDMTKAVYDTDNNGVVDNSAALNGHADTYFATAAHTHTDEKLLTVEGALTTSTGRLRIYNQMGGTKTIVKVFLSVDVAPTGSPIIVDVHKNGTSVFTTQANRPQIASGANTGQSTSIDVADWAAGEYLTMDVDQIGSGAAGADLTVHIVYTG